MAVLFGNSVDRRELQRRIGDMSQIAGVRPIELADGPARGVRALQFETGSGLSFTLLTDRGMDIYNATYNGVPLAWLSPAGAVAPAFYDPRGTGWLWSMPGGLLVTCGLTQSGPPHMDGDEELGLHGRASNTPARSVSYGAEWEDDDYVIWAMGEIREARLFGPNLLLRRTVHTRLGQPRIWIKDEVENRGHTPAPLMLLYHCNIGYPVVDEGSELLAVIENMEARDEAAEMGVESFDRFEAPQPDYAEQCFYIDHDIDARCYVNVALVNHRFNRNSGIGVYLSYLKAECPFYTQWKMMGEGAYVVGMEPGCCVPEGRASARERGTLKMLDPGARAGFHLEIGVLPSNNEIRAFEARLRGLNE